MAGCLKILPRMLPASLLLAGAASLGYAQSDSSLSDPTRPPLTVVEPVTSSSEVVPQSNELQTVIRREGRKPTAVINGMVVELGDKVGDATLVKLSESEAVLQGPAGREILSLTPGVRKTNSIKTGRDDGAGQQEKRTAASQRPESTP
ncbi:MAG: hypothetical protein NTY41_14625 [Proteobacteria bacterium]|nr:hypothetical protein [Pseudomonadota bacterium]